MKRRTNDCRKRNQCCLICWRTAAVSHRSLCPAEHLPLQIDYPGGSPRRTQTTAAALIKSQTQVRCFPPDVKGPSMNRGPAISTEDWGWPRVLWSLSEMSGNTYSSSCCCELLSFGNYQVCLKWNRSRWHSACCAQSAKKYIWMSLFRNRDPDTEDTPQTLLWAVSRKTTFSFTLVKSRLPNGSTWSGDQQS